MSPYPPQSLNVRGAPCTCDGEHDRCAQHGHSARAEGRYLAWAERQPIGADKSVTAYLDAVVAEAAPTALDTTTGDPA